jgi:hypothetical protein
LSDIIPIPELIAELSDPDARVRNEAARRLYIAGVAMCEPALAEWRKDNEFNDLLVRACHEFSPVRMVVGIAVKPESFDAIRALNGSPRLADVPSDQDAREFELHAAGGPELDILTTREANPTGAIAKYLEKFGEGIQQVEIFVLAIDRAMAILHSRFGVISIYPKAIPGANGSSVNFFLVPCPGGKRVLVELVQDAAEQA